MSAKPQLDTAGLDAVASVNVSASSSSDSRSCVCGALVLSKTLFWGFVRVSESQGTRWGKKKKKARKTRRWNFGTNTSADVTRTPQGLVIESERLFFSASFYVNCKHESRGEERDAAGGCAAPPRRVRDQDQELEQKQSSRL